MRISDKSAIRDIDKKSDRKSHSKGSASSLFASELIQQQSEAGSYEREVDELRNGIEQAGEKLEKEPTITNFKQFRELLSRLAKRISSEAYRLEKIGGTPQNPRYFEIITVINAEADRLYDLIIRENRNHLAITARVINIKGMVVDLIT
ncbi:MAG: YaaR family protein [Deltaproteobacteria bacterium]|nr:YaaR family protein [Deltaproteobacteria bacterium]